MNECSPLDKVNNIQAVDNENMSQIHFALQLECHMAMNRRQDPKTAVVKGAG